MADIPVPWHRDAAALLIQTDMCSYTTPAFHLRALLCTYFQKIYFFKWTNPPTLSKMLLSNHSEVPCQGASTGIEELH